MENNSAIYPITKESMHDYARKIFAPIERGENVTTVWVPMAGRRMWNKFIVDNIALFRNEMPNYENYLFIYVEPLDLTEESLSGYLRLMAKSFVEVYKKSKHVKDEILNQATRLVDDPEMPYTKLLEELQKLLSNATNTGLETVFILGEFDELPFINKIFCNNLQSLFVRLYPRLHYVFIMVKNVAVQPNISSWDGLSGTLLQNIVYQPIQGGVDEEYIIDFFDNQYEVKIPESLRKVIRELCGGHPYLIKVAMRILLEQGTSLTEKQFEELLKENYRIHSVANGMVALRSAEEKAVLEKIVTDVELSDEDEELLFELVRLHLVVKIGEHRYEVRPQLLKYIILLNTGVYQSEIAKTIRINETTGAILLGDVHIEEKFTRQEYDVLYAFLKNQERIITREDIGTVLWGSNNYEKYSDWAIDQLMSKLRKKLKQLGVDVKITTLRGRGYKMNL